MKFDFLNTIYARNGDLIGRSGTSGADAATPAAALARTLDAADVTRRIMGFPIEIETQITFRRLMEHPEPQE